MTPGGVFKGWYHGWNIVAVCVLAGIASNAIPINAYSLFLHDWATEWHAPISTLQLGIGAMGLGSALLAPLAGILVDRYSRRTLLAIGLTGMALSCFALSFANQLWEYLAIYVVPIPGSLLLSATLVSNAVVSRWFVRHLGLALSITAVGLSLAGIVMPPLVAALLPTLGWRGIWRWDGLLTALVILPLAVAVLRDRPSARHGTYYLEGAATAASHAGHGVPAGSGASGLRWRDILTHRTFWVLVIAYVPMIAVYGGCGQNIPPIAAARGFSSHTAGVLLSILSLSQLSMTMLAGVAADRFGNRLPLVALSLLTAVGGVLIALSSGIVTLGIGVALVACGGSFWPPLTAVIARDFGAAGIGRVFGLVMFFLPVATILGPFGVARVQEAIGSYTTPLLAISALSVVGALACGSFLRDSPPAGIGDTGATANANA
jgi:MFS family permease